MQAEHGDLHHQDHPSYLANLGLLSEPFANTPSGHFFYAGADGEQRLDLMHHLAPYSPLLVIIGEPGIGKTALMHQFAARAKDNWRIVEVTARADMDRDDLMGVVSEALGVPSQSQIDPNTQYLAVVAQLRALRQTAQIPILLIDDAQNLNASLLELLHKLCSENDDGHILSVILFGTPQLQTMWSKQALMPLAARVTHTFEVPPYTEEETARYIRHRLRAAGASDDGPFDSVAINKIHAASGGIPLRINKLAQEILMDSSMDLNKRHASGTRGGKTGTDQRRRLMAVAGVIVVVLLVAGPLRSVLFKSSPLPPPQSQQTRTLPPPPPAKEGGGEERVIRSGDAEAPPTPMASTPPAGEESSVPAPEVVKTLPLPPVDKTTVKELTMAESAQPAAEESQGSTAAAPATPSEAGPVEARPAVPTAPVAMKNKELKSVTGGADGSEWLMAQADSNFTLQLMAVKDENTARQFIEAHHLQGKAAYLAVKSHGQTLYAVVYGSFPQRDEAARAAKGLPAAWGTPDPWIRSFKSIHGLPGP